MWIIAYFFLHCAIYLAFRVQFLIWNWANLKNLSAFEVLTAFVYGLRFDAAALAVSVGLFLIGFIWLQNRRLFKTAWVSLFVFLNVLMILLNFADAELVNFTGRRFSRTSLFLVGEGSVGNLIFPYLGMFAITIVVVGLYIAAALFLIKRMRLQISVFKRVGLSFLILAASVIAFRGGLQLKPMTAAEARLFPDSMANHLVLNSTFTLLKSLNRKSLERVHYYPPQELLSWLNLSEATPSKYDGSLGGVNVVLILVESLSWEYSQLKNPEFTPYFNRLSDEGVLLAPAYANARRSIEGIGAVLAGIPAFMEEPFINSEFSSNEFIGIGHVLARQGYHSSFFHGAKNGSMHFDAFSKSMGIQHYFGENEYPDKTHHDGTWGIYDGPFLNWTCGQISKFPQPFFSAVFTLSSHQPYNIPDDGIQHPEGPHPILKAVHYTDSALEHFMACASTKPWYKNTLFIITADHAGPSLNPQAAFKSKFEIPILFYMADKTRLKNLEAQQVSQHIDILPTILETLKVERKSNNHLARSLWQPGKKVVALYSDGQYELTGDIRDGEKQLKAIRQYFSEGLFDNRLYYPTGSVTK